MKRTFTFFTAALMLIGVARAQDSTKCLQFNGDDNKVVVAHNSALNLGRSPFTIEAWINASGNMVANNVEAPVVFSKKGANSPSTDGILFGLKNDGKIALQIEGTSLFPGFGFGGPPGVTAQDLRDNICHHIAWTREVGGVQDTVNGYQDGAFVKKTRLAADTLNIDNMEDVWIGASEFNTSPNVYQFEGQIKEIRIWNYARTETEIWTDRYTHLTGNENGLIFYWRMHEDFGDTIYDCGPSGLHGVIDGASWDDFMCAQQMGDIPKPNNCVPSQSNPPPPNGISETNREINLVMYPNPIGNELRIKSDQPVSIDRVELYDMNGKKVVAAKWNGLSALNVSKLHAGPYMIMLYNNNTRIYKSMISKE